MTESAVARLLDTARIHTPGAMDGMLRNELFNVVTEFCQRSDAWQAEVEVPVVFGSFRYYMPPEVEQGTINRLLWLEGQRPATVSSRNTFGPARDGFLKTAGVSPVLELPSTPTTSETWHAHVALIPLDPTDGQGLPVFPAWFFTKYMTPLASGLIARMCAHPAKPYTSPSLAALHGKIFEAGVTLARNESRVGYRSGGQRWSFPQGFRSGSQRISR